MIEVDERDGLTNEIEDEDGVVKMTLGVGCGGKSHIMDEDSPIVTGEFSAGYVDGDGKVHDSFVVREMTGDEEDLLTAGGPVMVRLNRIVFNCLKEVGSVVDKNVLKDIVDKLNAVDRTIALLQIRRVTVGNFFDVEIECSNKKCKEVTPFSIDLRDIELWKMPDPEVRNFTEVLRRSKKTVDWHVMMGDDEEWVSQYPGRKDIRMSLAILARVDKIDGEKLLSSRDPRKTKKEFRKAISALRGLPMK
ncbi:MAG: hypothetical protein DRP09_16355, partial [Candidatus Thorarchaeota archaeon]